MKIRLMTIEDYEEVYSLWLSCSGIGLNNLDDSRAGISKFILRNPETCFVAESENMLVGTLIIGNDGRRGYIYHTAVHPNFRKQGIGRLLVQTGISSLRRLGINKVALVVFGRNKDANIFWEKLGFTCRDDIIYRNKNIVELVRIDT